MVSACGNRSQTLEFVLITSEMPTSEHPVVRKNLFCFNLVDQLVELEFDSRNITCHIVDFVIFRKLNSYKYSSQ